VEWTGNPEDPGSGRDQLSKPQGLTCNPEFEHLYICEYNNNRITIISIAEETMGLWKGVYNSDDMDEGHYCVPNVICHDSVNKVVYCGDHKLHSVPVGQSLPKEPPPGAPGAAESGAAGGPAAAAASAAGAPPSSPPPADAPPPADLPPPAASP
jgi:hypothetical protein